MKTTPNHGWSDSIKIGLCTTCLIALDDNIWSECRLSRETQEVCMSKDGSDLFT